MSKRVSIHNIEVFRFPFNTADDTERTLREFGHPSGQKLAINVTNNAFGNISAYSHGFKWEDALTLVSNSTKDEYALENCMLEISKNTKMKNYIVRDSIANILRRCLDNIGREYERKPSKKYFFEKVMPFVAKLIIDSKKTLTPVYARCIPDETYPRGKIIGEYYLPNTGEAASMALSRKIVATLMALHFYGLLDCFPGRDSTINTYSLTIFNAFYCDNCDFIESYINYFTALVDNPHLLNDAPIIIERRIIGAPNWNADYNSAGRVFTAPIEKLRDDTRDDSVSGDSSGTTGNGNKNKNDTPHATTDAFLVPCNKHPMENTYEIKSKNQYAGEYIESILANILTAGMTKNDVLIIHGLRRYSFYEKQRNMGFMKMGRAVYTEAPKSLIFANLEYGDEQYGESFMPNLNILYAGFLKFKNIVFDQS